MGSLAVRDRRGVRRGDDPVRCRHVLWDRDTKNWVCRIPGGRGNYSMVFDSFDDNFIVTTETRRDDHAFCDASAYQASPIQVSERSERGYIRQMEECDDQIKVPKEKGKPLKCGNEEMNIKKSKRVFFDLKN